MFLAIIKERVWITVGQRSTKVFIQTYVIFKIKCNVDLEIVRKSRILNFMLNNLVWLWLHQIKHLAFR